MKRTITVILAAIMLLGLTGLAQADVATWEVATVNGTNQFTIGGAGNTSLHYDVQPRNTHEWYWDNNNGSAPGVLATGGFGPNGWRDGSRTFVTTDVAVGQTVKNTKLVFDYKHSLGGYVTINYFLTDGAGKFGIFAPTSLGITEVGGSTVLDADWSRMTVDLTAVTIPDSTAVAIYEHNGLVNTYGTPFTTRAWGDIKNYSIAGMYDYQRSPAGGWDNWGTMFSQINAAGNSTIVNGYGLALIWGDTVGNTAYVTQQREIRNVSVSFGGTTYDGTFANSTVPEPGGLAVLATGLIAIGGAFVRRRRAA